MHDLARLRSSRPRSIERSPTTRSPSQSSRLAATPIRSSTVGNDPANRARISSSTSRRTIRL